MRRREFLKALGALALVPFVPLPGYATGGIVKGSVYLVGGCTSLNHHALAYNTGPSAWLQQTCIVYPNGRRKFVDLT